MRKQFQREEEFVWSYTHLRLTQWTLSCFPLLCLDDWDLQAFPPSHLCLLSASYSSFLGSSFRLLSCCFASETLSALPGKLNGLFCYFWLPVEASLHLVLQWYYTLVYPLPHCTRFGLCDQQHTTKVAVTLVRLHSERLCFLCGCPLAVYSALSSLVWDKQAAVLWAALWRGLRGKELKPLPRASEEQGLPTTSVWAWKWILLF